MSNTKKMGERVQLGFVGVAGRGYGCLMQNFAAFPDVEIVAVCDVYEAHRERAVEFTNGKAKAYHDYKDLLADPNVQAVVVATPPHWHALITLDALAAGKDVYCEKPMCRYPAEGRLMAQYAAKFGRITQVGTQIHATDNYRKCVNVVRSGELGEIFMVRNFCAMNDDSEGLGAPADTEPPAGLDWETWLGPAPSVPFNMARFRDGMHRYFKDYVDSWLHELGPHIVELPFWALELPAPLSVNSTGGRMATGSMADVPDTMETVWEFPNRLMTWHLMQHNGFPFGIGAAGPGRHLGIVFHGTQGTLVANYGLCEVYDGSGKRLPDKAYPDAVPVSPGQEREWIDGIQSRQECSCSFQNQLPMHTALNLAHLSLRLNRKLQWDDAAGQIVNDAEANGLLAPQYRAPYQLPQEP